MNNDILLEALIEDYVNGKLNAAEQLAFEELRRNNPQVDHRVVTHNVFLERLHQYKTVLDLRIKMDEVHQEIDVEAISAQVRPHPSRIVRIWRNNRSAITVAASFLILASAVLLSYYSQTRQEGNLQLLDRKVSQLNQSQNHIIRVMNSGAGKSSTPATPAKFGGTGFAVSANGYILTNYHVIKDADSLYIQNNKGDSYKVKKYYMDPINDIAILKVTDPSFLNLGALPYGVKKQSAEIGEEVYTLGYPKDDVVLGNGYVSSKTGINGDSVAYQIAVAVSPGNSGGPLLDNGGNIVGVINGKEMKADGAAFAVKPRYIIEALNAIPKDSLNKRLSYKKRNTLLGMKRDKQVAHIQDFVFMIKVYN